MPVRIPDDSDFSSFKDQCLSTDGWNSRYNKSGVTVWCREEDSSSVQKIKWDVKIRIKSVLDGKLELKPDPELL
ncbi:hypothetical protein XENOCAPTIV_025278 [Xenoophorus captivus]|uniref:Uncharacterized protein n=1 Tax=Xenoophorus captivus TaxID=1517983 RepID=A0ABV0QJZ0_9TELE